MKKAPKPFGFKALSWRRKRDSNYVPPIFSVPLHNTQLSKNGFIIDISSPPRFMRDKASQHIGGKLGGNGGSNGVEKSLSPRHLFNEALHAFCALLLHLLGDVSVYIERKRCRSVSEIRLHRLYIVTLREGGDRV